MLCWSISKSEFNELVLQVPVANTGGGGQTPVRYTGRSKKYLLNEIEM